MTTRYHDNRVPLHALVWRCCLVSTVLSHFQYFFGDDLLVAPVTQPVDSATQMVPKEIWIPEVTDVCSLGVQGAK